VDDSTISVNGKLIKIVSARDPLQLPWKAMDIDLVIEGTGVFIDEKVRPSFFVLALPTCIPGAVPPALATHPAACTCLRHGANLYRSLPFPRVCRVPASTLRLAPRRC
jgi:hypothetical protein